jgi:hypothetical protein
MKEMDLEELDQEVSKLMDQASKAKAKPASAPPAATTTAKPVVADDKDDTSVPVRRASLQITPRKKGIAMDIVQPKVATPPPPSNRPARVAPTLQPTKPVVLDEPAKEEKPADTPEPQAAAPDQPEKQEKPELEVNDSTLAAIDMQSDGSAHPTPAGQDDSVHKSVWPDPLEVHGFKDEDGKKPEPKATPEANAEDDAPAPAPQPTMQHTMVVTPPSDQPAEPEAKPEAEPEPEAPEEAAEKDKSQTSPFLETKVEKRPLGAYADKPAETAKKDDTPKIDDPKQDGHAAPEEATSNRPEPASIAVQTPKELSAEVVAVESAEPEFTPGAPKAEEPEEQNDMDSLRQMAIPQQYHEAEKEPSKEDRPLFDTKEYHPPLQPAATPRHSSKAGTIITFILIFLMMAAAAFAYFVVTGAIDISGLL